MVSDKQRRIFLVESCPHNHAMLVFYLTHRGHWVESANGIGTALARLPYDGFDVLLTGIWRPDANGWSLLEELRKRGELPPRVITMSAMPMDQGRTLSEAAGCHAHLARPFPLSELDAALE